jgi:hypothetical protein
MANANNVKITLFAYRRTGNLGDAVQTAAISRVFDSPTCIYRDDLDNADRIIGGIVCANGWFGNNAAIPNPSVRCLFAGIHFPLDTTPHMSWASSSEFVVGARDPHTYALLLKNGIRSTLIGCASMLFDRYDGPRSGTLSVDYDGPGKRLTHKISKRMAWPVQFSHAVSFLSAYRVASAVYTSRLHVALPCLAFGTPVLIAKPKKNEALARFSLLDAMGIKYGKLVMSDVSKWKETYLNFISSQLGINIRCLGEPAMPLLEKI